MANERTAELLRQKAGAWRGRMCAASFRVHIHPRERLGQNSHTTKSPGCGNGDGLATVYGVVQQSGGAITVESEPERCTTFRPSFPGVAVTREPSLSPSSGEALTVSPPTATSR